MAYLLKPSFAAGELAPSLWGRTDLQKYDSGAAVLKNFLVLRYGGVANRAGFRYLATTQNNRKAVLLPFRYNAEQNYIVEITEGAIRMYFNGALVKKGSTPVVVSAPYKTAELPLIKYTQSADVMFLVHPNHPPMTLTRYSATDWRLEKMNITSGPFDDPNTNGTAISASGVSGSVTLTASKSFFTADMVGQIIQIGHTVGSTYKKGVPGQNDSLRVECVPGGTVYVESFGFWNGNFSLEEYVDGAWSVVRTQEGNRTQNYNFTETNDGNEIKSYRITSTAFDTSVWESENEKQRGFVTIQTFSNDYYGEVKITSVTNGNTAAGTVTKKLGSTKATTDFSLGAWSNNKGYPACAGFFEDRLFFAGSKTKPQTLWGSKTGDYYNFGKSVPVVDDDAVTATLNSGQMNGIKGMISFGEIICLTTGGEYKVGGGGKALTPSNIVSQAQEYRGVNDVTPVVVGSRIIYVQQQGTTVRDLAYSYDVDKYTGDDLNLLALHLFEGHKIVSMAYQQTPNSIVWMVREDGVLLGMTYIKEQDVYAWHRHETAGGKFISVECVTGAVEDELYAVIQRGSNYYVEKMDQRDASTSPAEQFYVDSGITVRNPGSTEISGLAHLEGKEVSILADGNVLPRQTVKSGKITLNRDSYKVLQIGLPIDAQIESLPLELSAADGTMMSRKKRVARVMVMFQNSRGGRYGTQKNKQDEIKWRATENWNEAIKLHTDKQYIVIPSATYTNTMQVYVSQPDPLPMSILALVPELEAGG